MIQKWNVKEKLVFTQYYHQSFLQDFDQRKRLPLNMAKLIFELSFRKEIGCFHVNVAHFLYNFSLNSLAYKIIIISELYLEPSDNSFYGITGFANGLMRVAFIRGNKLLQTKTGTPKGGQVLNGGVVVAPKHTYQNRDQFQQVSDMIVSIKFLINLLSYYFWLHFGFSLSLSQNIWEINFIHIQ